MLESYYSILFNDQFDELFGHTWIGRNPTPLHNVFLVLHLDFSTVESGDMAVMEQSFDSAVNAELENLVYLNARLFQDGVAIDREKSATENLRNVLKTITRLKLQKLYVIIDEYDNFANQLITGHKDRLYKKLMADEGFLKTFFKLLKQGAQERGHPQRVHHRCSARHHGRAGFRIQHRKIHHLEPDIRKHAGVHPEGSGWPVG